MGRICSRFASRARSKVSVLVVLAMAVAIVPLVTSPASAVTGGTLTVQNQYAATVDVWIESGGPFVKQAPGLATGLGTDVALSSGNHDVHVCTAGSTSEGCAGASSVTNTTVTIVDGGSGPRRSRARAPSSRPTTTSVRPRTKPPDGCSETRSQGRTRLSACVDGQPMITDVLPDAYGDVNLLARGFGPRLGLVRALDVRPQEAVEEHDPAARDQLGLAAARQRAVEGRRQGLEARVEHLGGDRALPDQVVEPRLVARRPRRRSRRAAESSRRRAGSPRAPPGRCSTCLPRPRGGLGQVLGAVALLHQRRARPSPPASRAHAVGTHVGDVARSRRAAARPASRAWRHAELAPGLLLQRRGGERRLRARRCTPSPPPCAPARCGRRGRSASFVAAASSRTTTSCPRRACPSAPKSRPGRQRLAVERDTCAGKRCASYSSVTCASHQVGRAEGHALALALDEQADGDALHAAGREARRDLAPEQRADLVAVEPVEDAPRLLRVDQVRVDVAAVRRSPRGSRPS